MTLQKHPAKTSTTEAEKPAAEASIEDLAEKQAQDLVDRFADDPEKLAAVAAMVRRAAGREPNAEE